MVADSRVLVWYRLSQALAVAVTEEVSLTAVPAKRAKPSLERWSQEPRVGKDKSCQDIEEKDNRNGLGYFFSLAWITGAVAAMAEPPQIEEPTPIKVASFVSMLKNRWKKKAIIKAIEIVERMTGREDFPTAKTWEILSPKPSKITAYWSNFLEL